MAPAELSRAQVCEELATLGAAPATVYLDALYAYQGPIDDLSTFEPSALRAGEAFRDHVPLALLLERYRQELQRPEPYQFINDIILFCVMHACRATPATTVGLVIDTARAVSPPDDLYVLDFLGKGVSDEAVALCANSDLLGRLTAADYVAFIGNPVRFVVPDGPPPRADYLANRIAAHAHELTHSETFTAYAIAPEWVGTLDELLDTARSLTTAQIVRGA